MNESGTRRIKLRIDRLVLRGFRYEDRQAIAQGVQEQLTHLLSEPGMAQRLGNTGSIPRLRVGPVTIAAEAKPKQIGKAAADGIGKGLKR